MSISLLLILSCAIFLIALLYASVGHGGASGYLAVMALCSVTPAVLKPTALVLNILVASIATLFFARAGHFSWRLFWPFAVTSIPASFIGGYLNLPPHLYRPIIGVVLLFSAYRLISHTASDNYQNRRIPLSLALLIGALLGLLSGLTGVGGGIFLSPILLLAHWGQAREVAAVSALFILANSIAGLLGHLRSIDAIPSYIPCLALTALAGGIIGALLGSQRLPVAGIVRLLSFVLVIAGIKLLLV